MHHSSKYKLQRQTLTASTIKEADNHIQYWMEKSYMERLNAACFIINNIFNTTPQTKVQFSIVSRRKRNNG